MAIHSEDIRTRQAAVSGQTPESGGRIHPTEYVEHHEIGNLLPKLTEIDHAGGRVDLSKCYLSVETASTEQSDDAYSFLDEAPQDPLVEAVIFRPAAMGGRAGHTDERADALDYVEAYQVAGSLSPWFLRGLHVAGTDTVYLWSRTSARLPRVGQTLFLVLNEGEGGEKSQYVQIVGMTHTDDTFQRIVGSTEETYIRRIYQISISSRLEEDFTGPEVSYADPSDPDVKVRECVVAEGYHYYGLDALAEAAAAEDTSIVVGSVFAQITPVARSDVQIANAPALIAGSQTISSGGTSFTVAGAVHTTADLVTAENRTAAWPPKTVAPIPATGGKVIVHVRILGNWYSITEGESSPAGSVSVNRTSGTITASFTALPDVDSYVIFEWPASIHYTNRAGYTAIDPITMRGTLTTPAEPGSVSFSWLSGGVAKTASVAASGVISGHATGFVLHATGEWFITFSANLPDGNSQLTIDWDEATTTQETFTGLTPTAGEVSFTLASTSAVPGSLVLEWETQRQIERVAGYQKPPTFQMFCAGTCTPRQATIAESAQWGSTEARTIHWASIDDGAGAIASGGTVTYATGAVTLDVQQSYDFQAWSESTYEWASDTQTETFRGVVVVTYQTATGGQAHQATVDVEPLRFRLFPGIQDSLIPGTLRFSFGGVAISDRDGAGNLYIADGTLVGSVNYIDAEITLTDWTGTSLVVVVTSAISTFGEWTLTEVAFRTAQDALVSGSFQLLATESDGDALSATDDGTGTLSATGISGTVQPDIGVCQATFTNGVWPSSIAYNATATATVPLDPAIIGIDPVRLPPDGRVLKFRDADYICVWEDYSENAPNPPTAGATTALTNDALGFIYIEDGAGEETEQLPDNLVGGQQVQLSKNSRTGPLEYCVLEDAKGTPVNGALYAVNRDTWIVTMSDPVTLDGYEQPLTARFLCLVDPDLYEPDLVAGTVTWADPLDLTGYTQPLVIRSRGQDVLVAADVQHTGQISLLGELSRAYSQGAGVASLLIHGDLGARVSNLFEQHTWSSTWLDYLVGDAPTAGGRYDNVAYPVQVTNRGAIRERWRLKRRSDGQWDVIGETLGVIQVWDGTSTLQARRLPSQTYPYFTLYAEGLGSSSGWATGNFIQFETYSANAPLWVLRCVRPGKATQQIDSLRLRHRLGAE